MNAIKIKKIYYLLIAFIFISIAVICITLVNRNRYDFNKRYFQIVDEYDTRLFTMEELNEIYTQDDFLENLEQYNDELKKSSEYNFIEINMNPIEIIGHWDKPDSLANGYGHKDLRNQKVDFEGRQIEITPVDAMQMSKECQLDIFHREIFQNNDFQQNGNAVSLILGSSFKDYYEIGDNIEFIYLAKQWSGTVTGFLEGQTKIELDDFFVFDLDKFMIMPFFEQLSAENDSYYDQEFKINYYLSKNAGYLKLENKKEYKKANKYIENLASGHHLNYTLLRGY